MDDIIYGGDDKMSLDFANEMQKEFEISMIGEMKYFQGLHITQTQTRIFIS